MRVPTLAVLATLAVTATAVNLNIHYWHNGKDEEVRKGKYDYYDQVWDHLDANDGCHGIDIPSTKLCLDYDQKRGHMDDGKDKLCLQQTQDKEAENDDWCAGRMNMRFCRELIFEEVKCT